MTPKELSHRFQFHPSDETTGPMHQKVREACLKAARVIEKTTEEGREQSLAITRLEEAMYWANASIARSPDRSIL